MKPRTLLLLLITGAVLFGAWYVSKNNAPTSDLQAKALFPGLIDKVNDVGQVVLKSADAITQLKRSGDTWVVANRDNFPAKFDAVKKTILSIAEIKIIENKTSIAEKYATLGVNDPSDPDAKGVRVDLAKDDNTALGALIIGKPREGKDLGDPTYYARRADDETSYLVEGNLDFSAQIDDWIDSDVVDIDTSRVRKVTIKPDETESIVIQKKNRSDNFFELQNIPAGFKAKSRATVSSIGAFLLSVRFEDVAAASNVAGSSPRGSVEIVTFDGLVANIERYDYRENIFVKFGFAYDENQVIAEQPTEGSDATNETPSSDAADDDTKAKQKPLSVAEEVQRLNAKTEGWIYTLPDYKERMLDKRLGDMVSPIEDEKSPSADGDAAPTE